MGDFRSGTGELPPLDIICFANDWNSDPLSKKQIMTRLARRHRILWVNSINNRQPRLARKDLGRVFQKLKEFRSGLQQVSERIWVLTPLYLPFHGRTLFRRLNRALLGWQIRRAGRRLGFGPPVSWTYVPTSADVVGTLGEKFILYQCVDEFGAFSDAAGEVRAREQDLLAKSDMVLVCSTPLLESKRKANPHTYLVTHGVDFEHFQKATDPALATPSELRDLPRPILGFHGLIADWVDLELMAGIARLRPEWSIVLVGRADTDLAPLKGLANVHILGHRPYARLPEYLRGFDVALLPFVQNELTISANPLKLREYLAAGLPVVAAPLPEIARLGNLVGLATTAEEYVRQISALFDAGDVGPSRERSERVRNESWEDKVKEIENLLATALGNSTSGTERRGETPERGAVVEIGGSKTG
jgi:glycosyltransferase involved in cell wall biosynthesis